MLTIFSCPKPFRGHINIIQRNAIRSWTLLQPKPEIILIGDDEGTAEIANEFGLRHIQEVERNEYGTPLISSLFAEAEKAATCPIMCYVNADIIFANDLMKAINLASTKMNSSFLLVGRRWDIGIREYLSFGPEWDEELKDIVKKNKALCSPSAIDYFVFPKGLFKNIPRFAVGRPRWDNWIIWNALSKKIPVIDSTPQNVVVHQKHDYSHIKQKDFRQKTSPERKLNEELLGKWWTLYMYNIYDSTHVLTSEGVEKAFIHRKIDSSIERLIGCTSLALKMSYPYSYPIFVLGKGAKTIIQSARNVLHKCVKMSVRSYNSIFNPK